MKKLLFVWILQTLFAVVATAQISGPTSTCLYQSYGYTDPHPAGTFTMTNTNAVINASGTFMTVYHAGLDKLVYTYGVGPSHDTLVIRIFKSVSVPYGVATPFCFSVSATLSDSSTTGRWTSSNTHVATIGSTSGAITPVMSGSVTFTYADTNHACPVTSASGTFVIDTFPNAITYNRDTVCASPVGGIVAVFYDTPFHAGTYLWSSSNPLVATCVYNTPASLVTGISQGTATITFSLANSCGTNRVTQAVRVDQPAQTITGPSALPTNSSAHYINATSGGYWYLFDSTIASINTQTGVLITGTGTGTIVVAYVDTNYCGISMDTVSVTISAPYYPGITYVFDSLVYNQITWNASQSVFKDKNVNSVFIDPTTNHSVFIDYSSSAGSGVFTDLLSGYGDFIDQQTGHSNFIDQVTNRSAFVDSLGNSALMDIIRQNNYIISLMGNNILTSLDSINFKLDSANYFLQNINQQVASSAGYLGNIQKWTVYSTASIVTLSATNTTTVPANGVIIGGYTTASNAKLLKSDVSGTSTQDNAFIIGAVPPNVPMQAFTGGTSHTVTAVNSCVLFILRLN